MGLDMYLFMRKNERVSSYRGNTCDYPKEMEKFAIGLTGRDGRSISVMTDYKIGYWRKCWGIHKAIAEGINRDDGELTDYEICSEEIPEIVRCLKKLLTKYTSDSEEQEYLRNETKFAIGLFEEAKKFLDAHPYEYGKPYYDLRYIASW